MISSDWLIVRRALLGYTRGLTLGEIAGRVGDRADLGDIVVCLRQHSRRVQERDGRWALNPDVVDHVQPGSKLPARRLEKLVGSGASSIELFHWLEGRFSRWRIEEVLRSHPDRFFAEGDLWRSSRAELAQPAKMPNVPATVLTISSDTTRFTFQRTSRPSWEEFYLSLVATFEDPDTAHAEIRADWHHPGRQFVVHMERTVVWDKPAWVTWKTVSHPEVAEALQDTPFHWWSRADDVMHRPQARVARPIAASGPLLVTWTLQSPTDASASLVWLLHDVLNIKASQKALVRRFAKERSPVETKIRRILDHAERSRAFAVTTCAACGQPLSDPVSVARGIGPDCAERAGYEVVHALRDLGAARIRVDAEPWPKVTARMQREMARVLGARA